MVLDDGKTIGAVARDLDLTPSALRLWVRRAQAARTHGRTGLTTAEREELDRLRKENRELRTERDILNNQSRAVEPPDLWARNSATYALTPEATSGCRSQPDPWARSVHRAAIGRRVRRRYDAVANRQALHVVALPRAGQ